LSASHFEGGSLATEAFSGLTELQSSRINDWRRSGRKALLLPCKALPYGILIFEFLNRRTLTHQNVCDNEKEDGANNNEYFSVHHFVFVYVKERS
jgi:hypothetical protein